MSYNHKGFVFQTDRSGNVVYSTEPNFKLLRTFPDGTGGPIVILNMWGKTFAVPDILRRIKLRLYFFIRMERLSYNPKPWKIIAVMPNKHLKPTPKVRRGSP